jgi:hypothetical protein
MLLSSPSSKSLPAMPLLNYFSRILIEMCPAVSSIVNTILSGTFLTPKFTYVLQGLASVPDETCLAIVKCQLTCPVTTINLAG